MKWYDIEQNSPEWEELRAGRLTASNFAVIMANQPKAFSDAAKRLAVQIAFERINGHSMRAHYGDGYSNADMELHSNRYYLLQRGKKGMGSRLC